MILATGAHQASVELRQRPCVIAAVAAVKPRPVDQGVRVSPSTRSGCHSFGWGVANSLAAATTSRLKTDNTGSVTSMLPSPPNLIFGRHQPLTTAFRCWTAYESRLAGPAFNLVSGGVEIPQCAVIARTRMDKDRSHGNPVTAWPSASRSGARSIHQFNSPAIGFNRWLPPTTEKPLTPSGCNNRVSRQPTGLESESREPAPTTGMS